ncbi:MAG TPA: T9SS type A sorting domain-containing protein, partial [Flavisolibacter sp.]|nr:T9SS type A sorting domain-containing protein [Flavisolibacter sp.]
QRSFNVSFKTIQPESITFSAYEDANDNGVFDQADRDAGKLNLSGGPNINSDGTSVTVATSANTLLNFGSYQYNPHLTGSKLGVFVAARKSGNNYDNVLLIENSCSSTLPVNFKSFTATKTNGATTLKWTTSTEINNKGFYVQRFYNGQWENIMYIATKAEGGNSSADLNYSYDDNFNFKGVAQYRILQVDIDGKSKYSMVRSVSNGSQAGRISVYPNPAPSNANVSIVLGDASSTYDIQIVDNSGRIVKEFSAVKNTQQISNLPKGQYLARVKQRESNQVSVEKFIVQ